MAAGLVALDDDRLGAAAHQLFGSTSAGAKHTARAPPSRIRAIAAPGGMPPASTMWPIPVRETYIDQFEKLRVHRDQIDAERPGRQRRSLRSRPTAVPGDIEPEAMTPNPPALEIAATRLRSDTQVIAPPMIASSCRETRGRAPTADQVRARASFRGGGARPRSVDDPIGGDDLGGHPASSSP
jgi:hypothetical protein